MKNSFVKFYFNSHNNIYRKKMKEIFNNWASIQLNVLNSTMQSVYNYKLYQCGNQLKCNKNVTSVNK